MALPTPQIKFSNFHDCIRADPWIYNDITNHSTHSEARRAQRRVHQNIKYEYVTF